MTKEELALLYCSVSVLTNFEENVDCLDWEVSRLLGYFSDPSFVLSVYFGPLKQWPDLYQRWIIHLGRTWAKNGSSSDNSSVYKYGSDG